jgi:hypothetical protein
LAIVIAGTSAAEAQPRGMGRINGTVIDESGAPVEGAKVRTATGGGDVIECETDAKGKWTLTGVGRGEWQVSLAKSGFATKRLKIIIEREIERSQDIKVTLVKGA